MRIRTLFLAIPLGLLPVMAAAGVPQNTPPASSGGAPAAAADTKDEDALPTTYGSIDFGARTTTLKGDGARYERYRDLSDGLFLERARFSSQQNGWLMDLGADHVGRRDQRYMGSAIRPGTFKLWGQWDQIPMLMSRTTRTLYNPVTTLGVLEMDDAIQTSVQAAAANLTNFVPNARVFELSSRRHIFEGGAQYISKTGITISTNVRQLNRDGAIPFGGSFGHSNITETFAPVKHNLTDFDSNAEYVKGAVLVRGGYNGSWFKNDVTSLTFDNPWRVTDSASAGSQGRTALAPSNSYIGVNGLVSVKMAGHSRASVYASAANLRDAGADLLPFTVNTALVSPPLDRTKTEGHAKTTSLNLSFTSRPTKAVDIDVRYRTYDYDNRTPEFLVTKRVGYDNAVSDVTNPALQETEPFGVKRETFDGDLRFNPIRAFSAGIGVGRNVEERTHRFFEKTTDNTIRVLVDSVGNRWFNVRSKFERSQKRGAGDIAEAQAELIAIGEQAGIRHFDIAARDRNRATITGALTPTSSLSVTGSFAKGTDDYLQSIFGLRDNKHRVYSTGFDFAPNEYLGLGLSYSFERYTSLSRSRQANPGVQFDDPTRNWATDTTDLAHSVIAHAEILQYIRHIDITMFADINRAEGTYKYITGPVADRTLPEEVIVDTTLPAPTQLPVVRNRLARGNVDVTYKIGERWGLGVSVWYEKYQVKDFALDSDALTRLDPAGALLLGYQYLPYTATTYWVRATCKF